MSSSVSCRPSSRSQRCTRSHLSRRSRPSWWHNCSCSPSLLFSRSLRRSAFTARGWSALDANRPMGGGRILEGYPGILHRTEARMTIDALLAQYGVVILPALVVAEQVGVPLPAVPALLAVGALAASGRVSIPLVLTTIALVALTVDLGWYELGRRRGVSVLARLCRLSLEPDSCVRRTENVFARYGIRAMLIAKFVPGLTTVMPPLAGIF